jgi:hypothetical protein
VIVHLPPIVVSQNSNSNQPEETVYIAPASRRRDIRSTPSNAIYPEVAEGYQGRLESQFYTIDTVEIACQFIYQQISEAHYLQDLYDRLAQKHPHWTQLEILKYLLARLEVARRGKQDWPDQRIYELVLPEI